MVPWLRVTSDQPERILRDFNSGARFSRGEPYVGQIWDNPQNDIEQRLKAEADFTGTDAERYKAWMHQFGAVAEKWSQYMRRVRSIWTFAIPTSDNDGIFAVISVDSTQADAFKVDGEPPNSLFAMNLREATATSIVGIVHSVYYRDSKVRRFVRARAPRPERGATPVESPPIPVEPPRTDGG